MFPRTEVVLLARTALAAVACAERGRPVDGYECLADGLCHAREVLDLGADWATMLVQCDLALMTDYARRFGIHLA